MSEQLEMREDQNSADCARRENDTRPPWQPRDVVDAAQKAVCDFDDHPRLVGDLHKQSVSRAPYHLQKARLTCAAATIGSISVVATGSAADTTGSITGSCATAAPLSLAFVGVEELNRTEPKPKKEDIVGRENVACVSAGAALKALMREEAPVLATSAARLSILLSAELFWLV